MRDGELLLIDAATSFDHYSADVTRTIPVNGRFTPAQRDVYQIVRDAQEAFVRQIKPGVGYAAADDSGSAVVTGGLVRLGLIESGRRDLRPAGRDEVPGRRVARSSRLYALHGYGGHGIGLEVHDPAQYYEGRQPVRGGRRLHRRARALRQPRPAGEPARHARRTGRCWQDPPGGREVPGHRRADRGRLRADGRRGSSGSRRACRGRFRRSRP